MSIITNPITLPLSKFLKSITTLIGIVRINDTIGVSDIVNELVDSCRIGNVEFGKGIIYTFKQALLEVKDLAENTSPFTLNKPNMGQETIIIDKYKYIPISLTETLNRDAFLEGGIANEFLSFCMTLMSDTAQFQLFDECNKMYQDWEPKQTTQIIEVPQLDTTNLTGRELNEALLFNSNSMAKIMRKTVNNMKVPNSKFTDIAEFTDVNDGQTKKVISALKNDDLKLVMNDKYYTEFMANSLASLFHSEKIGEMIPGKKFCLLPEDSMATKNELVMGWLSDRQKFALCDFYKVSASIYNPANLYTNTFYHYSYGIGVFEHAPGVVFKAKIIAGK